MAQLPTSQPLGTHSESVANASFSKDRSLLATGDYAGTISLWNCPTPPTDTSLPPPPTGEAIKLDRTLPPGPTDCEWLAWHPLGNVFVGDGGGGVTCGAFSLCGKHLLSGGGDGTFRIWNPKNGTARAVIKTKSPVNTIHQKAEGDIVAVGGANGEINVVHLPTKKIVGAPMEHGVSESEVASVECLQFSGPYLASGAVDGNVKVFEVGVGGSDASGLPRSTAHHKSGGVTCLRWKEGGAKGERMIFTGCADGRVRLWDARPAKATVMRCFRGHGDMVLCLDLSEDGRVMVTGGDDHKILVWAV
ncbi:hypothetical protein TrRE_jg7078 [Triparma retinervis]|uniref:Uncharacterized protein n=1 Tax=Triparma retinervis TaxID=2557542 RepID=A0A9W6ZAL5_9STRA|nr:hypothetical protein TrRE_jg7078 [Triparma retinervis]